MMKSIEDDIFEIISNQKITNQTQLIDLLKEKYNRKKVTQATLSRILKRSMIVKNRGYYQREIFPHFSGQILDLKVSPPNMLVIDTPPGCAGAVAFHIDKAIKEGGFRLDEYILGTIAGDDTIFMVTNAYRDIFIVIERFKHFLRQVKKSL